jgi:hypothetical protein
MSVNRELSSNRQKVTSSMPVATEFTIATGDTDVIIVRHYWEFKRRASSLSNGAHLIERVPGDSI